MWTGSNRDNLTGYVLAGAAAWSALAFGAVDQKWFAPAELAVILLATVSFWRQDSPSLSRPLQALLMALFAVPLLQLIPLPPGLLALLSEARAVLRQALESAGVPTSAWRSISIYPFATLSAWLRLVCYLLVFTLAVWNYQTLHRQPALVGLMLGLGLFEALYGITQYLTGFPYIFLFHKSAIGPEATGTYINRNHYSGLLEMILPFLTAKLLSHMDLHSGHQGFVRKVLLAPQSSRFLRDMLVFVIVLLGLLFSLSRAGIAAGLLGLTVAGAIMVQRHRRSGLTLLGLVLLFGGGYAAWIGLAPFAERLSLLSMDVSETEPRMAIWGDTLRLIKDAPLFGTGLGTFEWASLHYQSSLLNLRYEHAHNDLLETASDLGVPLALALWGAVVALLIRLARKSAHFHRTSDRVLAAGCGGAITAILLHSFFDFNLQIPANALIFAWICGTATALSQRSGRARGGRRGTSRTIDITAETEAET